MRWRDDQAATLNGGPSAAQPAGRGGGSGHGPQIRLGSRCRAVDGPGSLAGTAAASVVMAVADLEFPASFVPSAPNSFLIASTMFAMGGVSWDKCLLVVLVPWLIRLILVNQEGLPPLETRQCEVKVHGKRDARVNWAASLTQGKRPAMEDYFVALPGIQLQSALQPAETAFLAVFDGHGGWETGAFLTQRLHEHIASTVDFGEAGVGAGGKQGQPEELLPRALERRLEAAYLKADLEWMEQAVRKGLRAGSTATTALLLGNLLICPNVGDSRTVICSSGKARALSEDHKPDLPRERARIEALGRFHHPTALTAACLVSFFFWVGWLLSAEAAATQPSH